MTFEEMKLEHSRFKIKFAYNESSTFIEYIRQNGIILKHISVRKSDISEKFTFLEYKFLFWARLRNLNYSDPLSLTFLNNSVKIFFCLFNSSLVTCRLLCHKDIFLLFL